MVAMIGLAFVALGLSILFLKRRVIFWIHAGSLLAFGIFTLVLQYFTGAEYLEFILILAAILAGESVLGSIIYLKIKSHYGDDNIDRFFTLRG